MDSIEYSVKRTVLAMRAMYFIYCGTQFIGQQYMSIYVQSFPFTDEFSVGLIMSLCYFVTTVAQPVWGAIADHALTKNRVLRASILGVVLALWLIILPKHSSFLTLVPSISLVFVFLLIPGMLVDTIIVENIDKTGVPFASVKCFYSAGAGAAALAMFLLSLAVSLKPSTAFILADFNAALSLIPLLFLPITKGHAHNLKSKNRIANLKAILKNKRLVLLLCYVLLLFIGIQATNFFLGIYYATDRGLNAGIGMFGLFFAICIAMEATLMSAGKFLARIHIHYIFLMVGISASLRSLTIFLAPNVYVIQIVALFHAFLFAPLWSRLAPYVNSIVTKEMRATGQAAWSIMVFGIGPMLGAAFGGVVADKLGIRKLFLVCACALFVTAVSFYFLFRHERNMDKDELKAKL